MKIKKETNIFYNPYERLCKSQGRWFKCNFHVHEGENVLDTLKLYKKAGYDIITISGQHELIETKSLGESINLHTISGQEYIEKDGILLINVDTFITGVPQQAVDKCNALGGFSVACHPHLAEWIDTPETPVLKKEEILILKGLTGIEIINGCLARNHANGRGLGLSCAADFWDEMLFSGIKAWGFGSDDFHETHDINVAWTDIYANSENEADVCEAVREGCLCASTGLRLFKFELDGNMLTVNANYPFCRDNRMEYRFIGSGGRILYTQNTGSDVVYEINPEESYIRIEVIGPDGSKLWTQPLLNKNIYKEFE